MAVAEEVQTDSVAESSVEQKEDEVGGQSARRSLGFVAAEVADEAASAVAFQMIGQYFEAIQFVEGSAGRKMQD